MRSWIARNPKPLAVAGGNADFARPVLEALEPRKLLSTSVATLHSVPTTSSVGAHANKIASTVNLNGTFTGTLKLKVGHKTTAYSATLSLADKGSVLTGALALNGSTAASLDGTNNGSTFTLVLGNGLTGVVTGSLAKDKKSLKGSISLGGGNGKGNFKLKLNPKATVVAPAAGSSLARALSAISGQSGVLASAAAGVVITGPAQQLPVPPGSGNMVNNVLNVIGEYTGNFTGDIIIDANNPANDTISMANVTRAMTLEINAQDSDGQLEGTMSVTGVGTFDVQGYIEDSRIVLVFTGNGATDGGGTMEGLLTNSGATFSGVNGGSANAFGFTEEFGGGAQRILTRGAFSLTYAGAPSGTGPTNFPVEGTGNALNPPPGPGPAIFQDTFNVIGTYDGTFTGTLSRQNPGSADTVLNANEVRHLILEIDDQDENGTIDGNLVVEGLGDFDFVGQIRESRIVIQFVSNGDADGAGTLDGTVNSDGSMYIGPYHSAADPSGFSLLTDSATQIRGSFAFTLGPGIPVTTPDIIQDGSFETPDVINDDYRPTGSPWIFQGTTGISQADNTSLNGPGTAADGEQYGFIDNDSLDPFRSPNGQDISQNVSLLNGFTYTLTYQDAGDSSYSIILDPGTSNAKVITIGTTPNSVNNFNQETFTFDYTGNSGTHKLQIESTGADGSQVFFDEFSMVGTVTPPANGGGTGGSGSNLALDGGFETPDITGDADQTGITNAGGAPWTFVSVAGITDAATTNLTGPHTAPEGAQYAFLQDATTGSGNQAGQIQESVDNFSDTSSYRLTFRDAGLGTYRVVLDPGTPNARILRAAITPTAKNTFGTESIGFTTTSGTHVLAFQGIGDDTLFTNIDDVQITVTGTLLPPPSPLGALPGSLIHKADGIDLPGGYTLPGGPIQS